MSKPDLIESHVDKNFVKIVISIIAFVFVSILIFIGVNNYNNNKSDSADSTNVVVEKAQKTLSGKEVAEDKKDATQAVQDLLVVSSDFTKDTTSETVLQEIEENNRESIKVDEINNKVRMVHEFEDNEDYQNMTYIVLVSLSETAKDANNNQIAPLMEDSYQTVYVDSEMGIAHVPLSIFGGPTFSLTMVYDNGEWKLDPYGIIDLIKLSANVQTQLESNTTNE